jgi:carbamoyltransferase
MKGSYLGPRFARADIRERLDKNAAVYQELEDEQLMPLLADILAAENVVGWFQGRMEFGPRAWASAPSLAIQLGQDADLS